MSKKVRLSSAGVALRDTLSYPFKKTMAEGEEVNPYPVAASNNTTILPEWLSSEIQITAYSEVGLSLACLLVGVINCIWIQARYPKKLIFRIFQLDSLATSLSQIGCIGILFSSIEEEPDKLRCGFFTILLSIGPLNFFYGNLFISTTR